MRLGSHSVPFRVLLAGVSLVGLGIAAALPTVADDATRDVDPIITESVNKVDSGAPSRTELPEETAVEPDAAPRQILQTQPAATVAAPVQSEPASAVPVQQSAASAPMVSSTDMANPAQPVAGLTATLAGEATDAGGIVLALDHARVMRMVGDVSTIIIGNPAIADASMPDPGTVVLTGKSYGETNMVMLDPEGNILAEQTLRVTVRGQSLVSVYRGVQRTTLSCAPTCEIRPTPGDTTETIEAGLGAFQARNQAALEAVRTE